MEAEEASMEDEFATEKERQKYKLELGESTEEEIKNIDSEIEQEIEDAVQFADQSSFPPPEEIFQDIYGKEL